MLQSIKRTVLWTFILLSNYTQSHIYRIEQWGDGKKNLNFLCDMHIPKNAQNMVADLQQNEFLKIVLNCGGFVIVEDVNSLASGMKLPIPVDKRNFLSFLTNRCISLNIPVVNVEYRHPSINPSIAKPVSGAGKIQLEQGERIKKEIFSYNDDPILNDYYQSTLNDLKEKVENKCQALFEKIKAEGNKTIVELMPQLTKLYDPHCEQALLYLQKGFRDETLIKTLDPATKVFLLLVSYLARYIDCRILHEIFTSKNSNIFVCAGATHIDTIKPILEKLGFKQIKMVGPISKIVESGFVEHPAISVKDNLVCNIPK